MCSRSRRPASATSGPCTSSRRSWRPFPAVSRSSDHAYPDDDLASPTLPPLPPLTVDYGSSPLTGHLDPKIHEPLIADLETKLARRPDHPQIRGMLAEHCNNLAWGLVTAPESARDPQRALRLARRAVELTPAQAVFLNTLGAAEYRAGQYAEALVTLKRSLAVDHGEFAAFDLFPWPWPTTGWDSGKPPAMTSLEP